MLGVFLAWRRYVIVVAAFIRIYHPLEARSVLGGEEEKKVNSANWMSRN